EPRAGRAPPGPRWVSPGSLPSVNVSQPEVTADDSINSAQAGNGPCHTAGNAARGADDTDGGRPTGRTPGRSLDVGRCRPADPGLLQRQAGSGDTGPARRVRYVRPPRVLALTIVQRGA